MVMSLQRSCTLGLAMEYCADLKADLNAIAEAWKRAAQNDATDVIDMTDPAGQSWPVVKCLLSEFLGIKGTLV